MQIINTNNLNQAIKEIQTLRKENLYPIIVKSQDDEFNRKILENENVDVLLSPESHNKKDRLKQRDSGLNEVLCKLAAKNNIKIAFDIDKIKNLDKKDKAIILARIKQNIDLCKRTNTKLILMPKQDKQETMSLMLVLGASTKQAKEAIE